MTQHRALAAAIEISPLFEPHWSGIPSVVAELTAQALGDPVTDWLFLYQNVIIPRDLVELLLLRSSGEGLVPRLAELAMNMRPITADDARRRSCIWTNIKSMAGDFRREAVIIYDISTLLTPEFHNQDTIDYHCNRLLHDCETSDHIFCISQASRDDVIAYLNITPDRTSVLPMGVSLDKAMLYRECERRRTIKAEPYIVILGTVEPRKNGAAIIELLLRQPDLLADHRLVFIGRDGWLDEMQIMRQRLTKAGISDDKILFTGYVSQETKLRLMLHCSFTIYPSFFEGFGLPVLESTVLGKICVTSSSSSLREVAPDQSLFFDPTDIGSLGRAVKQALAVTGDGDVSQPSFYDIMQNASNHGWARAYDRIRAWLEAEGEVS
ncbi:glycosyltransferase family 4 protein [Sphingobium limneticum]|jgi:glycosyltransferase involved in cell wall biosynthesis|uniref:glycosyltransferase family 4 protein n=1 Tax=Sphingobium limneticum TaxID=1007511 RepID=UPI003CFF5D5F